VNVLTGQRAIKRDFELLDKDIGLLEHQTKELQGMTHADSEAAMKNFVRAVRMVYEAKRELFFHTEKARHKIDTASIQLDVFEDRLKHVLNQMRMAREFSFTELAKLLEKSLNKFEDQLTFQIRYHDSPRMGFSLVDRHVAQRKELMQNVKERFDQPAFEQLMKGNDLEALRNRLKALAETRYDDLLNSLRMLDKLFAEFNTKLHNIYAITSRLEMMQGFKMEPRKGVISRFFSAIFGGKEEPRLYTGLSEGDKRRIRVLRGMVHKMHDTAVIPIRERQREVLKELRKIKEDEAAVRSLIKKGFVSGKSVQKFKMAA
jgi:hypothetical protein